MHIILVIVELTEKIKSMNSIKQLRCEFGKRCGYQENVFVEGSLKFAGKKKDIEVERRAILVNLCHHQILDFTHKSLSYQKGEAIFQMMDKNCDFMPPKPHLGINPKDRRH